MQTLSYYRYVIFQNKSIAAYMSNTLAKVFIFDNLKNKMCDARFIWTKQVNLKFHLSIKQKYKTHYVS